VEEDVRSAVESQRDVEVETAPPTNSGCVPALGEPTMLDSGATPNVQSEQMVPCRRERRAALLVLHGPTPPTSTVGDLYRGILNDELRTQGHHNVNELSHEMCAKNTVGNCGHALGMFLVIAEECGFVDLDARQGVKTWLRQEITPQEFTEVMRKLKDEKGEDTMRVARNSLAHWQNIKAITSDTTNTVWKRMITKATRAAKEPKYETFWKPDTMLEKMNRSLQKFAKKYALEWLFTEGQVRPPNVQYEPGELRQIIPTLRRHAIVVFRCALLLRAFDAWTIVDVREELCCLWLKLKRKNRQKWHVEPLRCDLKMDQYDNPRALWRAYRKSMELIPGYTPAMWTNAYSNFSGNYTEKTPSVWRKWSKDGGLTPLQNDTVRSDSKKAMLEGGVDVTQWTSHSIRGACATALLDCGESVATVTSLGMWDHISTFQRYYNRAGQQNVWLNILKQGQKIQQEDRYKKYPLDMTYLDHFIQSLKNTDVVDARVSIQDKPDPVCEAPPYSSTEEKEERGAEHTGSVPRPTPVPGPTVASRSVELFDSSSDEEDEMTLADLLRKVNKRPHSQERVAPKPRGKRRHNITSQQ